MAKTNLLNFNQPAPDLTLMTASGESVALSSFWAEKPLLLVFTRHFGCTQCKEVLDRFVRAKEKIVEAGLNLVVIMQGSPEETDAFAKQFAPGLTCLSDPDREAYTAFGLERGNFIQTVLNPKIWSAISASRKKGYRLESPPPGQDAKQMSGIFIINKQGRIVLPYYYDHIADHPPLGLLLTGILFTGWDKDFEGPLGFGLS